MGVIGNYIEHKQKVVFKTFYKCYYFEKKEKSQLDLSFEMSNETRIYIGNLPPDIRSKDIEDLFYKYGKIVFIDLKNRRGPPFAFVEFEDAR